MPLDNRRPTGGRQEAYTYRVTPRKSCRKPIGEQCAINARLRTYSSVSNIGDIRSLEEGSDEGSVVLDIDEIGLDALVEQLV